MQTTLVWRPCKGWALRGCICGRQTLRFVCLPCLHACRTRHALCKRKVRRRQLHALCSVMLHGGIGMQLPKEAIPQEDISMQQWLQRRGADADMLELADVCYANDFGTSLGRLGLTEAILEARGWDAGEEYLIRDRSFSHLVTYLAQGVQARVSWPVRRIEWHTGHGARICGPDSQVHILLCPPRLQRVHSMHALGNAAMLNIQPRASADEMS